MSTPNLSPIRVLLVEDHAMMRAGLRLLLANQPEMTLVGEAATSTEALAVGVTGRPLSSAI